MLGILIYPGNILTIIRYTNIEYIYKWMYQCHILLLKFYCSCLGRTNTGKQVMGTEVLFLLSLSFSVDL